MAMVEEEQDNAVSGQGDEGRMDDGDGMDLAVAMATMWRRTGWWRHRRRGCGKFWQPDSVQVKILWLGFKDRETRGFIGGP
jgi:hypothetical protein